MREWRDGMERGQGGGGGRVGWLDGLLDVRPEGWMGGRATRPGRNGRPGGQKRIKNTKNILNIYKTNPEIYQKYIRIFPRYIQDI